GLTTKPGYFCTGGSDRICHATGCTYHRSPPPGVDTCGYAVFAVVSPASVAAACSLSRHRLRSNTSRSENVHAFGPGPYGISQSAALARVAPFGAVYAHRLTFILRPSSARRTRPCRL